jgi:hypothetical protein
LRSFSTRWFARYAKRQRITDIQLCEAVARAERGLKDADLGGGLIKQRVARAGAGKSGGYRTIVAFRAEDRAVFLYGFAKNERENIAPGELRDLIDAAAVYLSFGSAELAEAVENGVLKEIDCDG